MELFHPFVWKILPVFLGVVALSIVLSAIISWLYRDRPEKIWNTWLKLAILLGVISVLISAGSLGKWAFLPVALFLAGWGWWELLGCIQVKYGAISRPALMVGLGALGILGGLEPTIWTSFLGVAIAAWLALVLPLLIDRQPAAMSGVLGAAFGMIFITLPVALLLNLLTNDYGEFSFLVLLVMSHDGFSQGCGLLGGKTLLIPQISPGKTWFGTVGGLLCCLMIGYLLRALVPGWQVWQVLCVAGMTSLMSLCGDLVASSLKREAGIKDFSRVLAVTGGILDKFDSLLFATPLFYFLAHYLRPSG
jgi:phosphatidate cytidylyltransferase